LNAKAPGSAVVDEVWLDGVSSLAARELARAIGRPPLERVRATFRDRVEARLRADPLGRAILWTLAAVAIVGLALALAGLALMLVADLGDRSELFDLEAQGAGPRALRRHVRLRSACVIALGVAGGLGLGAILSVLVVATVLVTANGSLPEPPLLLAVDWRAALLGFVVYLACTVALVSFVTQSAFRSKGAQP